MSPTISKPSFNSNATQRSWLHRLRRFFAIIAEPQGNLNDADAYILLGFGLNDEGNGRYAPGTANLALARWVVTHNSARLPTITQEGTYLALKELEKEDPTLDIDSWAINLPHDEKVHVDTFGAALQIWLIFFNTGIQRAVLVTHPWQSERSRRIFNKLPLDEIIIPQLPDIPFDQNSSQRWTRNKWSYLLFEFGMARPIGFLFGWL